MMSTSQARTFTCFDGFRCIASGPIASLVAQLKRALAEPSPGPVLLFDDDSGRVIDIDLRESEQQLQQRLSRPDGSIAREVPRPDHAAPASGSPATDAEPGGAPRGRGRPKLGVVAREVTLLPRHWDWLATQSGGASVALRKLVEQARRSDKDQARRRQERAYHFMSALAGDLPGFEESIRALFANDQPGFGAQIAAWPDDVRVHALRLAFGPGDAHGKPDQQKGDQTKGSGSTA